MNFKSETLKIFSFIILLFGSYYTFYAQNNNLIFTHYQAINQSTLEPDSLFFGKGSSWKYLDDGSDQGTAWQAIDFDDSAWSEGSGHMGFGEGDVITSLTPGYITYYFRKKVYVPDTNLLEEIYFNIVHDDGAVVYINGTEVIRSALMPSGSINYLTGTTTYIPNDVENDFWTYPVHKSHFQEGENIIAIEVHNQRVGSSDVSFDCFVSDTNTEEYKLDGPYVFYRDGKIEVKSISASGPQTEIYTDPADVNLICRFQNGVDSFSVQLQPERNTEPAFYSLPDKFLATSDIEGNLEALVMLLKDAGVMDEDFNWTFSNGHLLFIGDMFDRGNNVAECLWLLYRLESQAEKQGGKIHFILGNHEIMNLIYDFRYTARKYINNVQLLGESLESIYAGNTELGRWLRTKNIFERVGPYIFLHAGISPLLQSFCISYDEINYWARYRMDSICQSVVCNVVNGGSDYGAYWYRGMAEQVLSQQQVDDILSDFGGEIIVIGHTLFDSITILYENKVICIDLDHKDNFMYGFMEALYYEDGKFYEFHTVGTSQSYNLLNMSTGLAESKLSANSIETKVFPNPVTSTATFRYTLPPTKMCANNLTGVEIKVFNATGKLVAFFKNDWKLPGNYETILDLSLLQSGIYHYLISVGDQLGSGHFVIVN